MGKGKENSTTAAQKQLIEQAKKDTQEHARQLLGIKWDQPLSSGGNSDTGRVADVVFSNWDKTTELFLPRSEEDREKIGRLILALSVILAVINTTRSVDVPLFARFCTETYKMIRTTFPWASISPSCHRLLGHAAFLVQENGGRGLGTRSEQPLESCHKVARYTIATGARTNSPVNMLTDCFNKQFVTSDPLVRAELRQKVCSHCKQEGHSVRSCPEKAKKQKCDTERESLLESFLLD